MHFKTKIFFITALFCCGALHVAAQKLGAQSVLLFELTGQGNDLSIGSPKYITGYNVGGYNNQPQFFTDQELWLSTQTLADTTQTDIVALDLSKREKAAITRTRLSEYSPTLMPGGKEWSAIVVEQDGVQRLWRFPVSGGGSGSVVLPDVKGVGYHVWLNTTDLALFIVGEPHSLIRTSTKDKRRRLIASNPGRCLAMHPNGKMYFVSKATDTTWFLKSYDVQSEKQEIICQTLPKAEDFVVLADGTILMGQGNKLFMRQADSWIQIADLSNLGVQKITRLAARGGKLAMVVE
jgi:hypothetical protein